MTRPRTNSSPTDALGSSLADLKARLSAVELLAHTPCGGGTGCPCPENVLKAGDTMTGPLVLSGNPTTALQAAPKQYVDSAVATGDATRVAKAGDTMTGGLITPNLTASGAVRADSLGADGGPTLRPWTANPAYTGLATNGMTGSEYVVISDGTNAFLSGGAGGQVGVRAPINDPNNAVNVTSAGVQLVGRTTTPTQPYAQLRGAGGVWGQPTGSPLAYWSPPGFQWGVVHNVGNHFDTLTGTFVAPVTGVYHCSFGTYQQTYGGTSWIHWMWLVGGSNAWNGGTQPYNIFGYSDSAYADGVNVNHLIYVTAGNAIQITGYMGGDERFYSDYTYLSFRLVG